MGETYANETDCRQSKCRKKDDSEIGILSRLELLLVVRSWGTWDSTDILDGDGKAGIGNHPQSH